MDFTTPLKRVAFIKREKRFFAHCDDAGTPLTAHCANTGSLKGVLDGTGPKAIAAAYVSPTTNPKASLKYALELMELTDGTLVAVHTGRTNKVAEEWLRAAYPAHTVKMEAKYSPETRFDALLTDAHGHRTWVEVKTVTCTGADGAAIFPDAVSTRGQKHLNTLAEAVANGDNALQLYLVLRNDCPTFRPAEEIDPTYAAALRSAAKAGVQVKALQCRITPTAIEVDKPLPIVL